MTSRQELLDWVGKAVAAGGHHEVLLGELGAQDSDTPVDAAVSAMYAVAASDLDLGTNALVVVVSLVDVDSLHCPPEASLALYRARPDSLRPPMLFCYEAVLEYSRKEVRECFHPVGLESPASDMDRLSAYERRWGEEAPFESALYVRVH